MILFHEVFDLLLHVAAFLLPLFTAETRAFSVLEQAVLLRGEVLSHANQLLFRDSVDINCEVGNHHDIRVTIVNLRVLFVPSRWVVVSHTVRQVREELRRKPTKGLALSLNCVWLLEMLELKLLRKTLVFGRRAKGLTGGVLTAEHLVALRGRQALCIL